jgi:hypothetical protein
MPMTYGNGANVVDTQDALLYYAARESWARGPLGLLSTFR